MDLMWKLFSALVCTLLISSCAGQGKNQSALPSDVQLIYHDKDQNYWFGNGKATYKYDKKTLLLLTKEDGLVSNKILGVQEDLTGNIYFDTPDGVSKYDGERFTTLNVIKDHTNVREWKAGPEDLWFRMGWDEKGPYRYDGANLYYHEFPKSAIEDSFREEFPNLSYNPYSIYSMYKDSKGDVWFGTADMGIYCFDGKQVKWMFEKHWGTTPEGGAFGIRSIVEDRDGYYWFSNSKYKHEILPDSVGELKPPGRLAYKRHSGATDDNEEVLYLMSMHVDSKGILWMVNNDGIWKNDGRKLIRFFIEDDGRKISPKSIYEDNDGILWLGTESDGLFKYDGRMFTKVALGVSAR